MTVVLSVSVRVCVLPLLFSLPGPDAVCNESSGRRSMFGRSA